MVLPRSFKQNQRQSQHGNAKIFKRVCTCWWQPEEELDLIVRCEAVSKTIMMVKACPLVLMSRANFVFSLNFLVHAYARIVLIGSKCEPESDKSMLWFP